MREIIDQLWLAVNAIYDIVEESVNSKDRRIVEARDALREARKILNSGSRKP